MNQQKNILIADSGSTKTDWVLKHQNGVTKIQSAGLNPFYQSAEDIIEVLTKEVIPSVNTAVHEIHFYGAGCADAVSSKPVKDALVSCFPEAYIVEVASDMLGASRGLCGRESGLACILGTGANNVLYDGNNNVRSIGSLGFWLGDEGSGSFLGKTLVVHFLQNELPEDLKTLFSEQYPEINRLTVLDHAYKKPFPNRYFAAFTHFIGANISHPFLSELVSKAFNVFIEKYVVKHPETKAYKVHFAGSIAYHFRDILEMSLKEKGLKVGRILKSPMDGLVEFHS
ncbi:N-acetylglucosamine kinase [Dyadobacter sp. CY312]|uniref:N-acetylglucosamine kinase n=1 Tax=Dyadobacter sp. CY312 TaxID=2907303 RepID=UPI001F4325D4|nr:N-acetylglucosamine kinase [Dyadobacter sp. CY312]MCE7042970.1 N-acetylglucosamine kinase [Dyadobacter sp. CY312]